MMKGFAVVYLVFLSVVLADHDNTGNIRANARDDAFGGNSFNVGEFSGKDREERGGRRFGSSRGDSEPDRMLGLIDGSEGGGGKVGKKVGGGRIGGGKIGGGKIGGKIGEGILSGRRGDVERRRLAYSEVDLEKAFEELIAALNEDCDGLRCGGGIGGGDGKFGGVGNGGRELRGNRVSASTAEAYASVDTETYASEGLATDVTDDAPVDAAVDAPVDAPVESEAVSSEPMDYGDGIGDGSSGRGPNRLARSGHRNGEVHEGHVHRFKGGVGRFLESDEYFGDDSRNHRIGADEGIDVPVRLLNRPKVPIVEVALEYIQRNGGLSHEVLTGLEGIAPEDLTNRPSESFQERLEFLQELLEKVHEWFIDPTTMPGATAAPQPPTTPKPLES